MPRDFPESVVNNLLQFNFSFKVVSACFVINLRNASSTLLTLGQILRALSQYEIYLTSRLTSLFIFLIELLKPRNLYRLQNDGI